MGALDATTLSGRYFINQFQAQSGRAPLIRGKILGPIENEISPYYLCDLYPVDPKQLAITVQTVLSLDQLVGMYLYMDKETQDAEWDELQRRIESNRVERAKEQAEEAKNPTPKMPMMGPLMMVGGGTVPPQLAKIFGIEPSSDQTGGGSSPEVEEDDVAFDEDDWPEEDDDDPTDHDR